MLPQRWRFDQVAFPSLILFDKPDRFALQCQPICRDLLEIKPGIQAATVAVVLPQHILGSIFVFERAGVDRAALVGLANKGFFLDRFERPFRLGARRYTNALLI